MARKILPNCIKDGGRKSQEWTTINTENEQTRISDLVSELAQDSTSGREPWNSRAYKSIVAMNPGDILPSLREAIAQRDESAFLALEAIHTLDRDVFHDIDADVRCSIYVAALANARSYNVWGLPGQYVGKAGKHLITLGRSAVPYLMPYLDDRRRAPIWGSEAATVDEEFQNRVCDHAAVLLAAILGIDYEHTKDPSVRDANILRFREQFDG